MDNLYETKQPRHIGEILADIIKDIKIKQMKPITDLDFRVGDYVQISAGHNAGRLGVIIGIRLYTNLSGESKIAYRLKLSDCEGVQVTAPRLKLIRHAEAPEVQ